MYTLTFFHCIFECGRIGQWWGSLTVKVMDPGEAPVYLSMLNSFWACRWSKTYIFYHPWVKVTIQWYHMRSTTKVPQIRALQLNTRWTEGTTPWWENLLIKQTGIYSSGMRQMLINAGKRFIVSLKRQGINIFLLKKWTQTPKNPTNLRLQKP